MHNLQAKSHFVFIVCISCPLQALSLHVLLDSMYRYTNAVLKSLIHILQCRTYVMSSKDLDICRGGKTPQTPSFWQSICFGRSVAEFEVDQNWKKKKNEQQKKQEEKEGEEEKGEVCIPSCMYVCTMYKLISTPASKTTCSSGWMHIDHQCLAVHQEKVQIFVQI